METKKKLNEIDSTLISIAKEIASVAESLQFETRFEFEPGKIISKELWDKLVFPGLYFIEIKNKNLDQNFANWISKFTEDWAKYQGNFTPSIKKKRLLHHQTTGEWIPLYIGKSKNIGSRLVDHIYKEMSKRTFALKLKERDNMINQQFRFSTIEIDVKNYDLIVPLLEKKMRDKLHPIVGRQ